LEQFKDIYLAGKAVVQNRMHSSIRSNSKPQDEQRCDYCRNEKRFGNLLLQRQLMDSLKVSVEGVSWGHWLRHYIVQFKLITYNFLWVWNWWPDHIWI